MISYKVSRNPSGEWEAKKAELRVCIASSVFVFIALCGDTAAVCGDAAGVYGNSAGVCGGVAGV